VEDEEEKEEGGDLPVELLDPLKSSAVIHPNQNPETTCKAIHRYIII
jgi:hypothetical protein